MPSSITLGYWPATLDNLCWSKDDMIAVGGSEAVTILVDRINLLHEHGLTTL